MDRRRALVTLGGLGTAVLAGCVTGGSDTPTRTPLFQDGDRDDDGVPDDQDDFPDKYTLTEQGKQFEEDFELPVGDIFSEPFTIKGSGSIEYEVFVEGDTVDVLVMQQSDYSKWQSGDDDASYMTVYSALDTASTTLETGITGGEYVFAVDYTEDLTKPGDSFVSVDTSFWCAYKPGGVGD